jgi:DNA replication protein DnaC
MITNYQEQYEFAKDTLLNAIKNGDNVLLYGAGANGKSHLVNEMKKIIEQNRYHTLDYVSYS